MHLLSHPLLLLLLVVVAAAAGEPRYESKFCNENGRPTYRFCPSSSGDACPGNVTNDGNNCVLLPDCSDREESQCQGFSWIDGYTSRDAVCENGVFYTRHYANANCEGTVQKVQEGSGCYCKLPLRSNTQMHTHASSFCAEILTSLTHPLIAPHCESSL